MRFSVVIPTYRRPAQLTRCLDAIALLDDPRHGYEVIVVNDDHAGACGEIVQRYSPRIPVRAIKQPHSGPAHARNTGAAAASGEFLIFLDDDCAPARDWLRRWDEHVERHPHAVAGGATHNALQRNLCSAASHALVEFVHGYFNANAPGRIPFLSSNNLCVPADRFRALGGFSGVFPIAGAEDRDFCDRWHAHGWPVMRTIEPLVLHAHRLTLAGFWRQHANYGRGAFRLRRERQSRSQSTRMEPLGFYFDLIRFPWRAQGWARGAALSLLLCVSQLANAAGYFDEWRRSSREPHPSPVVDSGKQF